MIADRWYVRTHTALPAMCHSYANHLTTVVTPPAQTDKGRAQALAAGQKIRHEMEKATGGTGYRLFLYTSPYKRSVQTYEGIRWGHWQGVLLGSTVSALLLVWAVVEGLFWHGCSTYDSTVRTLDCVQCKYCSSSTGMQHPLLQPLLTAVECCTFIPPHVVILMAADKHLRPHRWQAGRKRYSCVSRTLVTSRMQRVRKGRRRSGCALAGSSTGENSHAALQHTTLLVFNMFKKTQTPEALPYVLLLGAHAVSFLSC